ncbi:MAG: FeoC-like transcriptional regulator [Anaerolineae bacterium]
MLEKLLQIIATGGTHHLKQLAQQLDVSEALLESMIEDLVRLGYLQPLHAKCCADCRACPSAGECALGFANRVWALTEAGKKLAQRTATDPVRLTGKDSS